MFSQYDKERYFAKVDRRGPDECWPWIAAIHPETGYGIYAVRGRKCVCETHGNKGEPAEREFYSWQAHRHGWEIENGPLPPDKIICHTCDNRKCQNPKHWVLADQRRNMADMYSRGRQPSRKGENNGRAKLNANDVKMIRTVFAPMIERGEITARRVASVYNVTPPIVGKILRGELWKHVHMPTVAAQDDDSEDIDAQGYRDQGGDAEALVGARLWAGNGDPF